MDGAKRIDMKYTLVAANRIDEVNLDARDLKLDIEEAGIKVDEYIDADYESPAIIFISNDTLNEEYTIEISHNLEVTVKVLKEGRSKQILRTTKFNQVIKRIKELMFAPKPKKEPTSKSKKITAKKGDRIAVKFDEGDIYLGVVTSIRKNKAYFLFDDGDRFNFPVSSTRYKARVSDKKFKGAVSPSDLHKFSINESVKVSLATKIKLDANGKKVYSEYKAAIEHGDLLLIEHMTKEWLDRDVNKVFDNTYWSVIHPLDFAKSSIASLKNVLPTVDTQRKRNYKKMKPYPKAVVHRVRFAVGDKTFSNKKFEWRKEKKE